MSKASRDNKKRKNNNDSKTDLPDVKTNAQTADKGKSMKDKI